MDLETACHDLREPGVIDEKLIYSAIIDQGPKGEEGRLFKQQGIVYEEISHLRLDFSDILKIDHLWMMTGLTKLQLSNNLIEKIENLDVLTNLRELDLSFNHIEKIENLDALLKLEILTLFQNKIGRLENLNHLTNLTVFSVGNNHLNNYDDILYLRKFESLRSFNMAGNPICENENFNKFAVAYLPQLVYYEYRMISKSQKEEAREFFLNDLVKVEREEEEEKIIMITKKEEEKQECINAEAFVEFLGGSLFFESMFDKDADCRTLLQMGDSTMEAYNEFKKNFTEITKELHAFGLQQLNVRQAEMERFYKFVGEAKQRAFNESRTIIEDFLEQKSVLFAQIRAALNAEVEDDNMVSDVSVSLQVMNESFKELCRQTWTVLMKKELHLFESTEDVNGTYERSMTELVNQFIEGAQGQFTLLRQMQNVFNEVITDSANKFFTNYTIASATGSVNDYKNLPRDLVNIMQDKDALVNALSASHDYHLLVIDQREDKLVTGIRTWLSNLVENLVNSEINRNRNAITEINHFLDIQKNELRELLLTRVGLLLVPKEIQDALVYE